MAAITQMDLIKQYFEAHPLRDISHPEVVDWATVEYKKLTGKVFRDPDRAIRTLHQNGYLQKVNNGIYRYDPDLVQTKELEDFSSQLRQAILERDNYSCVICGNGRANGIQVHVDHIIPKDRGGKATLDNGQTLCAPHNFRKKNYGQTESAKRMFILWYKAAKANDDEKLTEFFSEILQVYEKHKINGHISWNE